MSFRTPSSQRRPTERGRKQQLKKLNTALEDQFARMELGWDNTMTGIADGTDLTDLEKIVKETKVTMDKTLDDSRRLIYEKSVQNSAMGTPSAGHARIDDTLRPKDTLLWSFTLEEANLYHNHVRIGMP